MRVRMRRDFSIVVGSSDARAGCTARGEGMGLDIEIATIALTGGQQ